MKIYFCGAVRGYATKIETYKFIVKPIQELGHEILITHIISDDPRETKEKGRLK
ncbi:MAG: hypothetical protein AABW50_04795 [Nanoarchaeota archaeon]